MQSSPEIRGKDLKIYFRVEENPRGYGIIMQQVKSLK